MEVSYFNNNTPNQVSFYSSVPRVGRMRTEAIEQMAAYYSMKHENKLKDDHLKLIMPSPMKKKKKGKSKKRVPLTDRNIKAIKEVYLPPINLPKIKTTTNSVVFPSSPNVPSSTLSKMHSPQSTTHMLTPLFLQIPDLKNLMDTVKVKKSPRRKGEKKKSPLKSSTSVTSLLYAPVSQR